MINIVYLYICTVLWCTPSIFVLQISRLGYLISTGLGRSQDPLLSRWCCSLTLDGSQHLEGHFAWAAALVAQRGGLYKPQIWREVDVGSWLSQHAQIVSYH